MGTIVVMEGPMGSGKSTLAQALAGARGWPIYRAFRRATGDHSPGADPRLGDVPVNTYIEDICAADTFAQLRPPGVVMDRSLPSALAYDKKLHRVARVALMSYWQECLAAAGTVLIVFIAVSHEVSSKRLSLCRSPFNDEDVRIREVIHMTNLPVAVLDGSASREAVFKQLCLAVETAEAKHVVNR